jgi:hypothetical protein
MVVTPNIPQRIPKFPSGKPVTADHLNTVMKVVSDGAQDNLTAFQALMSRIQLGQISTGSIAASGTGTVTVKWPTAYQDLNYVAVASVEGASLQVTNVLRSKSGLQVTVLNLDGANPHTGTVMAIGFHL